MQDLARACAPLLSLVLSVVVVHQAAAAPVATGTGGAVATISAKASESALAILNQGGNAIDAAVAAAATLGVTDPFSCGIGGGGFMLIYLAKDQRVITIDHRETAPANTTPQLFQQDGKPIDFDLAVASGAAVGVPGTVRGWHEALERYGSMRFNQVLAPAIAVAETGFTVNPTFSGLIGQNEHKFRQFTPTSELYLHQARPCRPALWCAIPAWRAPTAKLPLAASRPSMKGRSRAPLSRPSTARQWRPAPACVPAR